MLHVPIRFITVLREWWRINFSKTASGRAGPCEDRSLAGLGRDEIVDSCRRLIVYVDWQHVTQPAA